MNPNMPSSGRVDVPVFESLAHAAETLLPGECVNSFRAMHCDPLYCAEEQWEARTFYVIKNDAEQLVVARQYVPGKLLDLTKWRPGSDLTEPQS